MGYERGEGGEHALQRFGQLWAEMSFGEQSAGIHKLVDFHYLDTRHYDPYDLDYVAHDDTDPTNIYDEIGEEYRDGRIVLNYTEGLDAKPKQFAIPRALLAAAYLDENRDKAIYAPGITIIHEETPGSDRSANLKITAQTQESGTAKLVTLIGNAPTIKRLLLNNFIINPAKTRAGQELMDQEIEKELHEIIEESST